MNRDRCQGRGLLPETVEDQVTDRNDHAGKEHVGRQAADDHDGQGLLHLRPGTNAQREGEQSQDGRQARHQDGPEPRAACFEQGGPKGHALGTQLLNVFDQQNAILHVQTDEENRSHVTGHVERRPVIHSANSPLTSDNGCVMKIKRGRTTDWN